MKVDRQHLSFLYLQPLFIFVLWVTVYLVANTFYVYLLMEKLCEKKVESTCRHWRFQFWASPGIACDSSQLWLLLTETCSGSTVPRMSPAQVTWQLWNHQCLPLTCGIASFPGPTQLSIICSIEKQSHTGRAWERSHLWHTCAINYEHCYVYTVKSR